MGENHPFTFNVMADPLRESRYRWTVCEGNQIHMRSPTSYATQSEAEKEAAKAVSRRVERWRSGE
jgi:GH24 family phage-related lysozyme (muramidase)